jgi:exopolyphosphatase / guanosine-5'-triphosphate,3'-diphosphate pyrophosphatase
MSVAVLDLGSNSFHLLVAKLADDGALVALDSCKEMVRLGQGTLKTGFLDEPAMRRGLDAIGRLAARAREHGCEQIVAVATSAIREAGNRRASATKSRRRHGIEIEVLAGDSEARLIYLGARSLLPRGFGRVAVVDVGGGSVELAVGEDANLLAVHSLPLGVLRLRDALVPGDGYVSEKTAVALAAAVTDGALAATQAVRALAPRAVVFTSGTALTVAALARELAPGASSGRELRRDLIGRLVVILSKFKPSDMSALGVEEGRSDTIATGAVVLATLFDLLDIGSAHVSERALREGVALRALDLIDPTAGQRTMKMGLVTPNGIRPGWTGSSGESP